MSSTVVAFISQVAVVEAAFGLRDAGDWDAKTTGVFGGKPAEEYITTRPRRVAGTMTEYEEQLSAAGQPKEKIEPLPEYKYVDMETNDVMTLVPVEGKVLIRDVTETENYFEELNKKLDFRTAGPTRGTITFAPITHKKGIYVLRIPNSKHLWTSAEFEDTGSTGFGPGQAPADVITWTSRTATHTQTWYRLDSLLAGMNSVVASTVEVEGEAVAPIYADAPKVEKLEPADVSGEEEPVVVVTDENQLFDANVEAPPAKQEKASSPLTLKLRPRRRSSLSGLDAIATQQLQSGRRAARRRSSLTVF